MGIKTVTIKKDTKAAKAAKAWRRNKADFRKAAKEGKAVEYARANPQQFAQHAV